MRPVLILNVGSSTIKWAFLGDKKTEGKEEKLESREDFRKAIYKIFSKIKNPEIILHRVVYGGNISGPKIVTGNLIKKLEKISKLAPLHNIPELEIIKICQKKFSCKQIIVFDTSFYAEMPLVAKLYGLPFNFYKQGIRRYGFHGLSHENVANKAGKFAGKIISCHLGAGCSITAISNKKPLDTSMGFTPLEGVVMMTRSGNIDPSVILYLEKEKKMSIPQINNLLNRKSGLFGISGIKDMR